MQNRKTAVGRIVIGIHGSRVSDILPLPQITGQVHRAARTGSASASLFTMPAPTQPLAMVIFENA
jgi:hypothetical protein